VGDLPEEAMNSLGTVEGQEHPDVRQPPVLEDARQNGVSLRGRIQAVEVDVPEQPPQALGQRAAHPVMIAHAAGMSAGISRREHDDTREVRGQPVEVARVTRDASPLDGPLSPPAPGANGPASHFATLLRRMRSMPWHTSPHREARFHEALTKAPRTAVYTCMPRAETHGRPIRPWVPAHL
jgi:hypothetical protein